jgi:sarcosine oxidase subunit beta
LENELPLQAEIAIVGAGVIGSALAMALADLGATGVVVYDLDLEGTLSSSELNAGGVRATFHQETNFLCSKISIDYFARHAEAVGYRPVGYLWIHRAEGLHSAASSVERWNRAGWPVETWDLTRLRAHAPFLDRTDDLAGALYGSRDGLLNPNLLKLHFRERARAKGVRFVDRSLLRAARRNGDRILLEFEALPVGSNPEAKESLYASLASAAGTASEATRATVSAERVVNCAGPWARDVARALEYACPSYSIRRQISLFDCREVDLSAYGMIIDPSGVYYHPEAGYILGGVAERDVPRGQNFTYGGADFFQEKIWLPLAEHSSKFEALRHLNGWAGLYEVSPDESAIVGDVRGSSLGDRVFESHSYSGHGVMHSYATGVALAERLVRGRAETVDLEPLNGDRFAKGHLLLETAVI